MLSLKSSYLSLCDGYFSFVNTRSPWGRFDRQRAFLGVEFGGDPRIDFEFVLCSRFERDTTALPVRGLNEAGSVIKLFRIYVKYFAMKSIARIVVNIRDAAAPEVLRVLRDQRSLPRPLWMPIACRDLVGREFHFYE